jgi:hypothetical protein
MFRSPTARERLKFSSSFDKHRFSVSRDIRFGIAQMPRMRGI